MEAIASDATALTPLLLNNASAMTELGARAEALGVILDEDLIGKSAKLRQKWDEVMGAMSARLTEFALYALEIFDKIFNLTEADAVLMMMYGSLSALVGAYFGFSGGAAKK